MLCPADFEDPAYYHSYILNDHLNERGVKYWTKNIPARTADRVVVMGEKITSVNDYYIQMIPGQGSDYFANLEKYRHGPAAWVELPVPGPARRPQRPQGS